MSKTLQIAMRDWDWLTPWLLGEVSSDELTKLGYELTIERVAVLPNLGDAVQFDGGEHSLSAYVRNIAAGSSPVTALPYVVMQGFRHHCMIVRRNFSVETPSDLAGRSIGVTGWPDSGNIWTRAAAAADGLSIHDAHWYAGRLTANHPNVDRVGGFGRPGLIEQASETPMTEQLLNGQLDAIFTPFMPPGFYAADSPFRPLYPDVRGAERRWVNLSGYVPGHHVLTFRPHIPTEVQAAVVRVLEQSRAQWRQKRQKLAETTLWTSMDYWDEAQFLPQGWDSAALEAQGKMLQEFVKQAQSQGILEDPPTLEQLFPVDLDPETLYRRINA